jgi:hypothetical protein
MKARSANSASPMDGKLFSPFARNLLRIFGIRIDYVLCIQQIHLEAELQGL